MVSDVDPAASNPAASRYWNKQTQPKQKAQNAGCTLDSSRRVARLEMGRSFSSSDVMRSKKSELTTTSSHSVDRSSERQTTGGGNSSGVLKNFRAAQGLNEKIFRCGTTDDLYYRLVPENLAGYTKPEQLVLKEVGLIVDLRSPLERSSRRSRGWMVCAPGGAFLIQSEKFEILEPRQQRTCLRLDPLSPDRFFRYMDKNWFSPQQKAQATMLKLVDGTSLHEMRMAELNSRGLLGLNEAILETGRAEFLEALRAITMHLEYAYGGEEKQENASNSFVKGEDAKQLKRPVLINCVQGKDRTGLLVMLCQSILDVSDTDILEDYHLSDNNIDSRASGIPSVGSGSINRNVFGRAPKQAMEDTLRYLRTKYGSVPGYLDSIGFDDAWRARLRSALGESARRMAMSPLFVAETIEESEA